MQEFLITVLYYMLWKADNGAVALGMNFHIRVFRSSFVLLDVETFSCRHCVHSADA